SSCSAHTLLIQGTSRSVRLGCAVSGSTSVVQHLSEAHRKLSTFRSGKFHLGNCGHILAHVSHHGLSRIQRNALPQSVRLADYIYFPSRIFGSFSVSLIYAN